jgi:hypothetical protein
MATSNEVTIIEKLSLPRPAQIWPPEMIVTDNGRVGTITRRQTPANGASSGFVAFCSWTVAEGDPPGDYGLSVSLNGFVYEFLFRVSFGPGLAAVWQVPSWPPRNRVLASTTRWQHQQNEHEVYEKARERRDQHGTFH